jgi:hypothetical protein
VNERRKAEKEAFFSSLLSSSLKENKNETVFFSLLVLKK